MILVRGIKKERRDFILMIKILKQLDIASNQALLYTGVSGEEGSLICGKISHTNLTNHIYIYACKGTFKKFTDIKKKKTGG